MVEGIGIAGYRGFGPELQYLAPIGEVTLLIGPNNAGKSSSVSFLDNYLGQITTQLPKSGPRIEVPSEDRHRVDGASLRLSFALPLLLDTDDDVEFTLNHLNFAAGGGKRDRFVTSLRQLLEAEPFRGSGDRPWVVYEIAEDSTLAFGTEWFDAAFAAATPDQWSRLHTALVPNSVGGSTRGFAFRVLNDLGKVAAARARTQVITVPAIREIREAGDVKSLEFGGVGLVNELARLQNPAFGELQLTGKFDRLNRLIQLILGEPDAELSIPHDRSTILVSMRGLTLPLEAVGTGIQEVVILASAAVASDESLICIEEPEIHLHPRIQRQLVRYLREESSNRFLFATHSAHLLDSPSASVVQVYRPDMATLLRGVTTQFDHVELCHRLGYRPSDLLQANCVVWVEGPSDRIYLNHWLSATEPDLIEGVHYSVMFYGGRLLNHLQVLRDSITPTGPSEREFIDLLRLNQHAAIVIDSDRRTSGAALNATKKRVVDEVRASGGLVWITSGREVENYVDSLRLKDAITSVHQGAKPSPTSVNGKYADALDFLNSKSKPLRVDKVAVALEVAHQAADLSPLDLRKRVEELVEFIRLRNDVDL